MANLTFISKNVNGIRSEQKRRDIFRDFHVKKYDVVYLQETFCMEVDEKIWQTEWGGRCFFANGSNRSRGVAIMFKKGLNLDVTNVVKDLEGRYIILNVSYEGELYTFTNLYGPNCDSPEFFMEVFQKTEDMGNDLKVICGDFNLVLSNKADKRGGGEHAHKRAMSFVNDYMETEELIDVWRELNQEVFNFTWYNNTTQVRLDFF